MKADPLWVRDSLVEDVTRPSQEDGRVVDANAASEYIVGILERMDRKQADAKPVPQPKSQADKVGEFAVEFERRTGRSLPDALELERNMPERKLVALDKSEAIARQRLAERLRWIKSKPDLYEQVKGPAAGLLSKDKNIREKAAQKLRDVIAKTDRLCGHEWHKPKPKRLTFG